VIAFNALPATFTDDMWAHQYLQMSNQIACEIFPGKSVFRTNGAEAHIFGLEPNYGCCTANFNQAWPKLALSAMLKNGDNVISALPVPCSLNADGVCVQLATDYPFENKLVYTVSGKKDFTLTVRIPSFARNLTVDGAETDNLGRLDFCVKTGETRRIEIAFDTLPYVQDRPNGLSCVRCGSLVFAIPIKSEAVMLEYDRGGIIRKFPYCDYELKCRSEWRYALASTELTVERKKVGEMPFFSQNPPITVKAKVKRIEWDYEDGYDTVCAKTPGYPLVVTGEEQEISLYPYGCAKLRMTEIPLIKK